MNKRESRTPHSSQIHDGDVDYPELYAVEKELRRFRRISSRVRGSQSPGKAFGRRLIGRSAAAFGFIVLLAVLIPPFRYPVEGTVTSNYFLRWSPDGRGLFDIEMHRGLDIGAKQGTAVIATRSGVVERVEEHPTYGKLVVLRHLFGMRSYYAHLSQVDTRQGALLIRGFTVGKVGNTGRSTGPHLHFELRTAQRTLPPGLLLVFHDVRRFMIGI